MPPAERTKVEEKERSRNAKAQQAHRQKKKAYIQNLEEKIRLLEKGSTSLPDTALLAQVEMLQAENLTLKDTISELRAELGSRSRCLSFPDLSASPSLPSPPTSNEENSPLDYSYPVAASENDLTREDTLSYSLGQEFFSAISDESTALSPPSTSALSSGSDAFLHGLFSPPPAALSSSLPSALAHFDSSTGTASSSSSASQQPLHLHLSFQFSGQQQSQSVTVPLPQMPYSTSSSLPAVSASTAAYDYSPNATMFDWATPVATPSASSGGALPWNL